jgi:hypothetical protein
MLNISPKYKELPVDSVLFALCREDGQYGSPYTYCRDYFLEYLVIAKELPEYRKTLAHLKENNILDSKGKKLLAYGGLKNPSVIPAMLSTLNETEAKHGLAPTKLLPTDCDKVYELIHDPWWEQTTVHMSLLTGEVRHAISGQEYDVAPRFLEGSINRKKFDLLIGELMGLKVTRFTGANTLDYTTDFGFGENRLHQYNGVQAAFYLPYNRYYPQLKEKE